MDSLSITLQPYKEPVGTVASVLTITQFFAGAFICMDIFKNRSTKGVSSTPFVGGLTIGVLMLKYAFLLEDPAMLQVNVAALILNGLYILFYNIYSSDRWNEIYMPLSYATALIAVLYGYAEYENPMLLEYRYGLIVTILMLLLLASPLKDIGTIISTKDASSIPFPITFMGLIVSALWLVYGIILNNTFMVVQNGIGIILCWMQLVLFFAYRGKAKKSKSSQKKD